MKTKTLIGLLVIIAGLFIVTSCSNDEPIMKSKEEYAIVGKWKLVELGIWKLGDDERQELTFDALGGGTLLIDNSKEKLTEKFHFRFVDGDNGSNNRYLRIYSKNPSIGMPDSDYARYNVVIKDDKMWLYNLDTYYYVDRTPMYIRVK
jgi:hypothetical protein